MRVKNIGVIQEKQEETTAVVGVEAGMTGTDTEKQTGITDMTVETPAGGDTVADMKEVTVEVTTGMAGVTAEVEVMTVEIGEVSVEIGEVQAEIEEALTETTAETGDLIVETEGVTVETDIIMAAGEIVEAEKETGKGVQTEKEVEETLKGCVIDVAKEDTRLSSVGQTFRIFKRAQTFKCQETCALC